MYARARAALALPLRRIVGAAGRLAACDAQLQELKRNKRYRNKRGRKFRANLRIFCKNNFANLRKIAQICVNFAHISRKSGQIRANSAKFACFHIFLTYTTVYYTTVCSIPMKGWSLSSPRTPGECKRGADRLPWGGDLRDPPGLHHRSAPVAVTCFGLENNMKQEEQST